MESVGNVWIDAVSYFTPCEPCWRGHTEVWTWGHLYVKKWILFNPAYISLDEMKAALSAEWVREKVKVNRGKRQRLLYEWPSVQTGIINCHLNRWMKSTFSSNMLLLTTYSGFNYSLWAQDRWFLHQHPNILHSTFIFHHLLCFQCPKFTLRH